MVPRFLHRLQIQGRVVLSLLLVLTISWKGPSFGNSKSMFLSISRSLWFRVLSKQN